MSRMATRLTGDDGQMNSKTNSKNVKHVSRKLCGIDKPPTERISPKARSGCFQPCQFRLEFEAQLCAFLFWQPIGHLWENGPIK